MTKVMLGQSLILMMWGAWCKIGGIFFSRDVIRPHQIFMILST